MSDAQQNNVGAPGFAESLIPVWGSGREAVNDFQTGHYVKGVFWTAMAVSDVFMVGAIAKGGVKIIGKAGAALIVRESETTAGKTVAKVSASGLAKTGGSSVTKIVTPVVKEMSMGARQMTTRIVKGPWRPFGSQATLLRSNKGWIRLIYDPRKFKTVSREYWKISSGADGKALHHLFFQNQTKWIPEGLRNAGFNLLEIPASLNTWMGGRLAREASFRLAVTVTLRGTFLGSYQATQAMLDHIDHQLQASQMPASTPAQPSASPTGKPSMPQAPGNLQSLPKSSSNLLP